MRSVRRKKITTAGFSWFRIIEGMGFKSIEVLPLIVLAPNRTDWECYYSCVHVCGIYVQRRFFEVSKPEMLDSFSGLRLKSSHWWKNHSGHHLIKVWYRAESNMVQVWETTYIKNLQSFTIRARREVIPQSIQNGVWILHVIRRWNGECPTLYIPNCHTQTSRRQPVRTFTALYNIQ